MKKETDMDNFNGLMENTILGSGKMEIDMVAEFGQILMEIATMESG